MIVNEDTFSKMDNKIEQIGPLITLCGVSWPGLEEDN